MYPASCQKITGSEDTSETLSDKATLRNRLYLGGIIASIIFHGGLLTHLLANGRLPSSVAAEKEAPAIVIEVIEAKNFERLLSQRASEDASTLSNMAALAEKRIDDENEQPVVVETILGDAIEKTASVIQPSQAPQIQLQSMTAVSDSEMHALNAFPAMKNAVQSPEPQVEAIASTAPFAPVGETAGRAKPGMPNFRSAQELWVGSLAVEHHEEGSVKNLHNHESQLAVIRDTAEWQGVTDVPSEGLDTAAIPVPTPRPSIRFLAPPSENSGKSPSVKSTKRASRSGARRAARWAYRERVKSHLARHKPFGGRGSGSVSVVLSLSRNGDLLSAEIARSSGNQTLEQAVLDAVQGAVPFPEPPVNMRQSKISYVIPYRFE